MPRVSNLLAENQMDEFKVLIQKSYDFTLAIALPLTVGMFWGAPCIVRILCGDEFIPSILSSQIIAPIILMVSISNVMGIQVLYPKGKINLVIQSCLIGAITDLILNICLIPSFPMKVQPLLIWAQKWSLRFPCILLAKNTCLYPFQETPSELFGWMCCNVHCVNSYFSICLFFRYAYSYATSFYRDSSLWRVSLGL